MIKNGGEPMTIQIACVTLIYNKYTIERAFEQIAEAGYKDVVLWNRHEDRDIFEDDSHVDEIQRLLRNYDLTPVMLFAHSQFHHDQPLQRAIAQIEIAHALGIRKINILTFWGYRQFPNQPIGGDEYGELDRKSVEHLQAIAPYAENSGIEISIKPHTANTATGEKLRELIRRIGSPAFKACYDPGNIRYYEGVSPEEDIKPIIPYTSDFIAKDHRGSIYHPDFPVPGEGEVNFLNLFNQLHAAGFTGSVIVEKVENKGENLSLAQVGERILKARLNMAGLLKQAGFE